MIVDWLGRFGFFSISMWCIVFLVLIRLFVLSRNGCSL